MKGTPSWISIYKKHRRELNLLFLLILAVIVVGYMVYITAVYEWNDATEILKRMVVKAIVGAALALGIIAIHRHHNK